MTPAPRRPLGRRGHRLLRDLRVSFMLAVLTLLPTAAPAHLAAPLVAPRVPQPPAGREPQERQAILDAYIIYVPGIAGPRRIDRWLVQGMLEGGAATEVEIFDWLEDRRGLTALFSVNANRRQARRLAERLIELREAEPDRPLIITAHSGGTAIAAWALEMIPEIRGQKQQGGEMASEAEPVVDGVILIASGLSPQYDLSSMLRQVRGSVFHLSSSADNLILGAGTLVFGTLDRKHGIAAGKTGFYLPPGVAETAYGKFLEIPYDRTWVDLGHMGDHEGMLTIRFGQAVMADLVRASLGLEVPLPEMHPARPAPAPEEQGEPLANPEAQDQQRQQMIPEPWEIQRQPTSENPAPRKGQSA